MKTMKKKIKKTVNKKSTVKKVTKSAKKSFSKDSQAPDIKTLGLLAAALVIVVLAALFVARLGKGNITENGAKNTVNKTEIIVPKIVSQCPKSFYEKTNNIYKVDAAKYARTSICQYYKTIKGTTETIHNLQYTNEVTACRFFDQNGQKISGETKYIHLGYEKKACTQGLYAKKQ